MGIANLLQITYSEFKSELSSAEFWNQLTLPSLFTRNPASQFQDPGKQGLHGLPGLFGFFPGLHPECPSCSAPSARTISWAASLSASSTSPEISPGPAAARFSQTTPGFGAGGFRHVECYCIVTESAPAGRLRLKVVAIRRRYCGPLGGIQMRRSRICKHRDKQLQKRRGPRIFPRPGRAGACQAVKAVRKRSLVEVFGSENLNHLEGVGCGLAFGAEKTGKGLVLVSPKRLAKYSPDFEDGAVAPGRATFRDKQRV